MGVSVEVWRARVGTFQGRGPSCNRSLRPHQRSILQHGSIILVPLILINILLLMGCVEPNPGPINIKCPTCNTPFTAVSTYAKHQEVHATNKKFSFPCIACADTFQTVSAFNVHYSRFHARNKSIQNESAPTTSRTVFSDVFLNVSYTCTVPTCGETLRTASLLRKHLVGHLKAGYVVLCPFQPCKHSFTKVSTYQVHISQYHKLEEHPQHPEHGTSQSFEHGLNEASEHMIRFDDDDCGESDDEYSDASDSASESSDNEEPPVWEPNFSDGSHDDLYPENLVRDHVGKFYLMLEGEFTLPTAKVQRISQEIAVLYRLSHHRIRLALKAELARAGIDEDRAKSIIDYSLKKDIVYAAHHKKMDVLDVTTHHMRKVFYKQKCANIEPVQIFLGFDDDGKKRYAHHIPIKDTLHAMFNDPTVQREVEASFSRKAEEGIYQDYTDGSTFTQHQICSSMECIHIILFQDAFEFYALSPSSGLYKCVGFYFILGNINPDSRSKVDAIQLAFIVRETDLKFFKPENCLKKLIAELQDLAENGILFQGRKLPVVLMHLCGDNLGQHYIGRYVESFTANYFCRFCEVTSSQIKQDPCLTLALRTIEDYNETAAELDPDDPFDHKKGIKGVSVFNEVPFFHVCNPGLPPCIGHDVLEGIARTDYALYLRYFIEIKGWVTVQTLNRRISNLKFKGRDAADSIVKLDPQLKKIRGHASEVWLFMRMLPFLIEDKIQDKDDPVWQLCLQLKIVCEYVFAPKISLKQIAKLKELSYLYVETRALMFNKKIQPKHHYLCHYAELISYFGPLIRLWTMRFESRHVFFKRAAKSANNFINITKTLATKYVLNFAYKFTSELFSEPISYNSKDVSILNQEELEPAVVQVLSSEPAFNRALKTVTVHGILYCPGLWVVLGSERKDLILGEILLILFDGKDIKFVVKIYKGKNSFQGYYSIEGGGVFGSEKLEGLADYYPVPAYTHQGQLCISLKHSNPIMDE